MTFKPGQSGNPSGRPKENAEVKALARKYTVDAIKTLAEICRSRKHTGAARVSAAQVLLDRAWGKPTQPIAGDLDEAPLQLAPVIVEGKLVLEPAEAYLRMLNGNA